jgi:hypothetical protein
VVFSGLVDFADERMVEGGGGLGFPQKPLAGSGVAFEIVRKEFQGHFPVKDSVSGEIDFAHTTPSQKFEDFIMDDPVAGTKHFAFIFSRG